MLIWTWLDSIRPEVQPYQFQVCWLFAGSTQCRILKVIAWLGFAKSLLLQLFQVIVEYLLILELARFWKDCGLIHTSTPFENDTGTCLIVKIKFYKIKIPTQINWNVIFELYIPFFIKIIQFANNYQECRSQPTINFWDGFIHSKLTEITPCSNQTHQHNDLSQSLSMTQLSSKY